MNIDNRIPDSLLLLISEKERKMHVGFPDCGATLPTFRIGKMLETAY
jgi:hypothetical protein